MTNLEKRERKVMTGSPDTLTDAALKAIGDAEARVLEQQDRVDNAMLAMVAEIVPDKDIAWDAEKFGDLRETILGWLEDEYGLAPDYVYPPLPDGETEVSDDSDG